MTVIHPFLVKLMFFETVFFLSIKLYKDLEGFIILAVKMATSCEQKPRRVLQTL